jgi:hypothetical protein
MPLVTGTANSMSDLVTALRNACTANGWTLSGNVLHKDGCYADVRTVVGAIPSTRPSIGSRDYIVVRAGNGIDGSNALTDEPPTHAAIGPLVNSGGATDLAYLDWTFPVTYHIHVNAAPDEVWLAVQYNGTYFQHLAFGKSPTPGNPGTGNWLFATLPYLAYNNTNHVYRRETGICYKNDDTMDVGAFGDGDIAVQPFWINRGNGNTAENAAPGSINYAFHSLHSTTGAAAWNSGNGYNLQQPVGGNNGVGAAQAIYDVYRTQPNAWNQESILLPCQPMKRRPENKSSIVGDIRHMRYIRMDFMETLDVVDRTPDLWRVYPCYRKGGASMSTGAGLGHSGGHAVAIRYDAP